MNGPTAPTVRIVLDLNDLELAQFRRVIDEAPRAARNGRFIAKALDALQPHVTLDDVERLNEADYAAHGQKSVPVDHGDLALMLLHRQAE